MRTIKENYFGWGWLEKYRVCGICKVNFNFQLASKSKHIITMKIEGRISILVSQKGATIEIKDDNANVNFLEIQLSPEQFMACLGRLSDVKCQLEVKGLDKVGKTHENSIFEFKLPDWYVKLPYKDKSENHKQLSLVAQNQLSDGWVAENYFGSQNSFFTKDGEDWARVTIRRWI